MRQAVGKKLLNPWDTFLQAIGIVDRSVHLGLVFPLWHVFYPIMVITPGYLHYFTFPTFIPVLPVCGKALNLLILFRDLLEDHLGILVVVGHGEPVFLVHHKIHIVLRVVGAFVRALSFPMPLFSTGTTICACDAG